MDSELCQVCGAYWDCEHTARTSEVELQYVAPDGRPAAPPPGATLLEGTPGGPTESVVRKAFTATRKTEQTPLSRMYRTPAPLNPPVPGREVQVPVRKPGVSAWPLKLIAALTQLFAPRHRG